MKERFLYPNPELREVIDPVKKQFRLELETDQGTYNVLIPAWYQQANGYSPIPEYEE